MMSYSDADDIQIHCSKEDLCDYRILEKEKHDSIMSAIKKISEKERKIIKMYFFYGIKLSEISRLLKIPLSTVHKTKEKAIKNIKAYLELEK